MKKLTPARAAELEALGITHIASIVKSYYNTKYYKYETLEAILTNGGKMPEYIRVNGFVYGVSGSKIDWEHTTTWSKI